MLRNKLKGSSRSSIIREALQGVTSGEKILLYGISGIGKTFILRVLEEKTRILLGMSPMYIDLNKISNERSLLKIVLSGVKRRLVNDNVALKGSYTWKILQKCGTRGLIDCITPLKEQLLSDFNIKLLIIMDNLHNNKFLTEDEDTLKLFDIATSMKILPTIWKNSTKLRELTIKPLDAVDIMEIFKRAGLDIPFYLAEEIESSFTGIPLYLNIILAPIRTSLKRNKPIDLSYLEMLYRDPIYRSLMERIALGSLYMYLCIYGKKFTEFLRLVSEMRIEEAYEKFPEFEKIGFLNVKKNTVKFVDKFLLQVYKGSKYQVCL